MAIGTLSSRIGIILWVALGTLAYAQGTSVLLGTVTDAASGAKLADAVVTATSPAMQGTQTAVTDSTGYYRIPGLPPGRYTIRVEKEGYRPFSRNDLDVSIDRQYRVNVASQPETMSSEEIRITGLPPIIDVGSVNQGAVVNSKVLERIPLIDLGPTNYTAASTFAPQVSTDMTGGFAFSGSSALENSYSVDGVSVRNIQTGANGALVPVGFINEVNVITGGFQAEVGRSTGGALRAITRSGTNEFHGDVWVNYSPGGMLPMKKPTHSNSSVFVTQNLLWNAVDINATLGGPILKDRIWFFMGFNPGRNRVQNRSWLAALKINDTGDGYLYDSDGRAQYTTIDGTRRTRFTDNMSLPYIAKLTFLLATNHTLTLTTNGTYELTSRPYTLLPRGPPEWVKWNGGSSDNQFNNSLILQYQGSFFQKRLLAQAQVSWYRSSVWLEYSDGSSINDAPPGSAMGTPAFVAWNSDNKGTRLTYTSLPWLAAHYDAATRAKIAASCDPSVVVEPSGNKKVTQRCPLAPGSISLGGFGNINFSLSDTVQSTFSLTYLLTLWGHHVWKTGFDYEWQRFQMKKGYSGGVALSENPNGSSIYALGGFGYMTGPDQINMVKYMITTTNSHQVAWYLQDSWSILDKVTLNAGVRFDYQQLLDSNNRVGLTLNNQIAPRISVIWDPTQQGRSKLYASYGRYFESVPLSMGDRLLNSEPQFGNWGTERSPKGQQCDPLNNFGTIYTTCLAGKEEVVDRVYGNPSLSYKHKIAGSTTSPVDPNLKPQSTDEITAGFDYEIFRDARIGASYTRKWMNYVIEDMSLDEGRTYFISNPGYGLGSAFPKAVRNYNAVTAQFSKTFSSGWMAQASYTWMTLTGNYEGLIHTFSSQSTSPNSTQYFDLQSLLVNANGRLPGTQTHTVKFYGGKEFPIGNRFSFGIFLGYIGRSGAPINYLGAHMIYGSNAAFVLPMGTGGDMPWVHKLDLLLTASVQLPGGVKIQLRIDSLNFINLQGVTSVDQTFTASYILPLPIPHGANPQIAACVAGINRGGCIADSLPVKTTEGNTLARSDINKNFKMPVSYQDPFTARLSLRLSF